MRTRRIALVKLFATSSRHGDGTTAPWLATASKTRRIGSVVSLP
jgi:hypothetical protein